MLLLLKCFIKSERMNTFFVLHVTLYMHLMLTTFATLYVLNITNCNICNMYLMFKKIFLTLYVFNVTNDKLCNMYLMLQMLQAL